MRVQWPGEWIIARSHGIPAVLNPFVWGIPSETETPPPRRESAGAIRRGAREAQPSLARRVAGKRPEAPAPTCGGAQPLS